MKEKTSTPNVTSFGDYSYIGTLYIPENYTNIDVHTVNTINAYGSQRANLKVHATTTLPSINWNCTD